MGVVDEACILLLQEATARAQGTNTTHPGRRRPLEDKGPRDAETSRLLRDRQAARVTLAFVRRVKVRYGFLP